MPHLETIFHKTRLYLCISEGVDPLLQLTVDVVNEASRPWYVVHLGLLSYLLLVS